MKPNDILFQVATFHNTSISEVKEKRPSRKANLKAIRHDYYWVAYLMSKKGLLKTSLTEIGRELNQNHCTVLHAFKQVNNLIDTEKTTKLQKQTLFDFVKLNVEYDFNSIGTL
jgi:chromosomal replication initiation ATPase DnaA